MPRMHIMEQVNPGQNLYSVIVHAPAPAGNNSANVPWATAIVNAGLAVSQMTVGNGAGQITQSEQNQVAAGSVIEAAFLWGDDPSWDNATRLADLNTRAGQAVAEITSNLQARLKQFGRTVA